MCIPKGCVEVMLLDRGLFRSRLVSTVADGLVEGSDGALGAGGVVGGGGGNEEPEVVVLVVVALVVVLVAAIVIRGGRSGGVLCNIIAVSWVGVCSKGVTIPVPVDSPSPCPGPSPNLVAVRGLIPISVASINGAAMRSFS